MTGSKSPRDSRAPLHSGFSTGSTAITRRSCARRWGGSSPRKSGGRYSYTYASWKPTAKRELAKMTLPEVHLFIARCLLAESFPPDPQDTDLLRELAALAKLGPKKDRGRDPRGGEGEEQKPEAYESKQRDSKVSAKKKGKTSDPGHAASADAPTRIVLSASQRQASHATGSTKSTRSAAPAQTIRAFTG